jgi:hypothetical protein
MQGPLKFFLKGIWILNFFDSDMLWWQREHFIWVDPYCGLTPNLIYKAKMKLL